MESLTMGRRRQDIIGGAGDDAAAKMRQRIVADGVFRCARSENVGIEMYDLFGRDASDAKLPHGTLGSPWIAIRDHNLRPLQTKLLGKPIAGWTKPENSDPEAAQTCAVELQTSGELDRVNNAQGRGHGRPGNVVIRCSKDMRGH